MAARRPFAPVAVSDVRLSGILRAATAVILPALLPHSAWAITLSGLGSHTAPAESSVEVSFSARPDSVFECDMVLGPDPGLSYRWDADRDGQWDTGWSDAATFLVSTAGIDGPGVVDIPVQAHCYAFDLFSLSYLEELGSGTLRVDVTNVPPVLGSYGVLGVAADALVEGTVYDFGAFATDVEAGDTVAFTWRWSDGVDVSGNPARRAFDDGTFQATVVARDDDGGTDERSYSVTVRNVPPTITALDLPEGLEGTPIVLGATVVDPFDTPAYTWTIDGATYTGPTPAVTLADDGSYGVRLVVDDGDDTAEATGTLVVRNVAPTATLSGDTDDGAGPTLRWQVHVVDPGADGHTVDWDFGDGGSLAGVGTSASHDYASNGEYTVTATVTDDDGATGVATLRVVISGFGPRVTQLVAPSPVDEGAATDLSCAADDVWSTGSLTYAWRFDDGSAAAGASVRHTWVDEGTYVVRCTVTDGAGQATFATASVDVRNVAPTLSGTPSGTAMEGNAYRFSPMASDPGADTLTWTGTVAPGARLDAATGRVDWTPARGQAGTWAMSLRVDDGDGGSDTVDWTVQVAVRDVDGDGMSDYWEQDHGLDPTDGSDGADDPDGDGRTNLDEYAGDTDPHVDDRPAAPELLSPGVAQGLPRTATDRPALRLRPVHPVAGDPLVYDVIVATDEAVPVQVGAVTDIAEPAPGVEAWAVWTVTPALTENARYTWTARASDGYGDGPWAPLARFQVNTVEEAPGPAVLSWPPDASTVDRLRVPLRFTAAVDPDEDVVHHTVVLETPAGDPLQVVDDVQGTGLVTVEVDLAADTRACWHVEVADDSGLDGPDTPTWCFLVDPDNAPPSAPSFSYPTDGLVIDTTTPELVLRSGVDPEGRPSWQHLELDTVATFDGPDVRRVDLPTAGAQTRWSPGELTEDTWYHARALASDGGAVSAWSSIAFFVNAFNRAPTVPRLVRPDDGEDTAGRITFEVADVVDPEGLGVTVDVVVRLALGTEPVVAQEGVPVGPDGRASWRVDGLPPGEYRWSARSVDAQEAASAWAPQHAFWVVDPATLPNSRDLPGVDGPGSELLAGCACTQTRGTPAGVGALLLLVGVTGGLGVGRRRR
ncbi:MAG: PKD domain-containing protein [Alphaproteobacteria bacterium]|nr:PKD domain-containing protein [Alphaproteobacteria bacterium]